MEVPGNGTKRAVKETLKQYAPWAILLILALMSVTDRFMNTTERAVSSQAASSVEIDQLKFRLANIERVAGENFARRDLFEQYMRTTDKKLDELNEKAQSNSQVLQQILLEQRTRR